MHRPEWTVATFWRSHSRGAEPVSPFDPADVASVEELSMSHQAVVLAADVLRRVIVE